MYAEIIESSDRILAIRTQRFRVENLSAVIYFFVLPLTIITLRAVIKMGNVAVFKILLFLSMALLLLFVGLRQMSLGRGRKPIFSREIVFDKIHKRIEIKGKEESVLTFDNVKEIRYEHTRHFGSSGGSYGESLNKYSLALRTFAGRYIYIATGGEVVTGLRDEISRVLGKPVTYVGSAGHLESTQDQIFRAAQEKLNEKRDE